MFKHFILAMFVFFAFMQQSFAQHIYYKKINLDSVRQFKDSVSRLVYVKKDTTLNFENHFNYVLKFFPEMDYRKITVILKPGKRVARIKPTFMCFFLAPKKRHYKMYFSTKCKSTLDSVILNNLDLNSQLGLIARQMGYVQDLSTDGFFDLVGWHFRQKSRASRKRLEHENELKVLEQGLGYQMLALSIVEDEKLKIQNWTNARAYTKYVRHYKNEFMSPAGILNFIKDMPVYVSHKYRTIQ